MVRHWMLAAALLSPVFCAGAQTPSKGSAAAMLEAHGTFDVKLTPLPAGPGEGLAAMSLDKSYAGALRATAKGQMLSAGDPASGNAGYVALERIQGTLAGKAGSFALQQQGTMSKGTAPQMTATIVPGSGTGDLSGIYGSMLITVAGGKHSYVLRYAFSE